MVFMECELLNVTRLCWIRFCCFSNYMLRIVLRACSSFCLLRAPQRTTLGTVWEFESVLISIKLSQSPAHMLSK